MRRGIVILTAMTPMAPYWTLSSFYFWFCAALGAFTPFFARWLTEQGLDGYAVGIVMAMWYFSRIISPPTWSLLCARAAEPIHLLRIACLAMTVCYGGFLLSDSFAWLLMAMLAFGYFANAVLPQYEAITLDRLGERREQYGRIRIWGSVGFLVVAMAYGPLLDAVGRDFLPQLTLPLLLATCLCAFATRGVGHPIDAAVVPRLRDVLRRAEVRNFLLVVMLMQVSFGPFYVLYTLHLGDAGYSGLAISALWGIGVVAEIIAFLLMPALLRRWSQQGLLLTCLAATSLRWVVVALFPESISLMVLAQLVHSLSFGAFHALCMLRIVEFFPGRLGQRGQGMLHGLSSGVGGVIGALVAGALWEAGGGRAAFLAGAAAALLALVRVLQGRQSPART